MPTLDELKYKLYKSLPGKVQKSLPGELQADHPHATRNKLLAAGAAGLAGLGGYKYFRSMRGAVNPALQKVRDASAKGGFSQLVDLTKRENGTVLEHLKGLLKSRSGEQVSENLTNVKDALKEFFMVPYVDKNYKLNLWNKLKLHATAGEGAIPTTMRGDTMKFLGNKDVGAVNFGLIQHEDSVAKKLLGKGGKYIAAEGDKAALRGATEMGKRGKGFEAALMQQYAPGAMPTAMTDFNKSLFRGLPKNRVKAIEVLQQRLQKLAPKKGLNQGSVLKPVGGLSSGGELPGLNEDWAQQLKDYYSHTRGDRAAFRAAKQEGGNALSDYLRGFEFDGGHSLYQGHTLHEFLKKPRSAMLQKFMPNQAGELRVHAFQGHVPENMIYNRHLQNSEYDVKAIRDFAQKHLDKLPEKFRQGSYGMDVMTFKNPRTGKISYKMVEMNPYEHGTRAAAGGGSGMVDPHVTARASGDIYKTFTGRDTQARAAGKALGLAGAAGLGTYGATKLTDK